MSRFGTDYDYEGPNTAGLWWHTTHRSLRSARGLKVLREVERALLALDNPRLIDGAIADREGGVCAVGAWAKFKIQSGEAMKLYPGSKTEFSTTKELSEIQDYIDDANETAEFGAANGMGKCIAWAIAHQNDENAASLTPEVRYEHVLAWVRKQINQNPHFQAEPEPIE